MAAINGSIKLGNNWTQTNSSGLPGSLTANLPQNWQFNVNTAGDLADQADLKYTATLTFVASTPQTLDLTALTDVFGAAINFKRVRSIAIRVKSTTDGATLTIGNAASNAWTGFLTATGTLTIQASSANNDAFFVLTAPNTTGMVVGSSSKILKLDPGTAAFNADIEIVGCVA